ncbi:MAG: protein jag [Dehalococcoidia bacterium]|nr:protein jag [Dehalococcoidia bacterium]
MRSLEVSAKTVEEAIQKALERLGVSREEVEVTVVKEGKHGILGLGAEEAMVKVRPLVRMPEKSKIAEAAKGVLETLLTRMGVIASVVPHAEPSVEGEDEASNLVSLDVTGDDLGILIGRRGQTLSSLQHIVRLIVAHQAKARVPIVIDVEGYKQRRYGALQALARRMAEQVKVRGMSFTLEPMPAYERRIIHLTLVDDPDVATASIGEGEARKVVIMLKET